MIGSQLEDALRALGRLLDGQQAHTAFVGVSRAGVTVTAIDRRGIRQERRLAWADLATMARLARQARGQGGASPPWPLDCQALLRLAGQEMARADCSIAFIVVYEHELMVDFGDEPAASRQVYGTDLLRQRVAARVAARGLAPPTPA